MEEIDIVLPWVDDTDPEWKLEREKYISSFTEKRKNLAHYFRDWDTLRYVFRGIEKNMPWIRYVHFITCGHLPSWLNSEHPQIKIHIHKDFFSRESVLPTFSSHPIEMNLSYIPDLAEKFVYFNDDTLVVKKITPERFFRDNRLVDYLVLDLPRYGWIYDHIRIKDSYGYICKNDIDLVNEKYPLCNLAKQKPGLFFDESYSRADRLRNKVFTTLNYYKWIKLNHNPQAFLLSSVNECVDDFKDKIDQTSKNRFRTSDDVNQYLYRFYNLFRGNFIPHYFNDDFCLVLSSVKRYKRERENLFRKTFICVNDSPFLEADEYPELKELVDKDLSNLFPSKSSFEV
ncbi:MAG: Stealth CR1 domain-containing protein [Muribaculaceae bacterium]|nr:Stealth CR1 domain-containing protein [Muribaculaceae bacterium]